MERDLACLSPLPMPMDDLATQASKLAAQALAVAPDAIRSCEPIKHGLTNESWLVRVAGDAVVVRISNTAEDALQIDRASEAAVLAAVAAAGIGAPVLLCDPQARILVTRYMGEHWPATAVHEPGNIIRVAQLLRRLHRVPAPAQTRTIDLPDSLAQYYQTLDAHGAASHLTAPALRQRALQVAASLQASAAAVLCHNDVHHLNLIDVAARGHDDVGSLRLIDWEYAGLGPPAFDLASICVYEKFTPPQRHQLLVHYGAGHAADAPGLEQACWLFDYIRELWMAVRERGG